MTEARVLSRIMQNNSFATVGNFVRNRRLSASGPAEKSRDAHVDDAVGCAASRQVDGKCGDECVLIASSSWWAFPAQMAMVLAGHGIKVSAVCPRGNPLRRTYAVRAVFSYNGFRPLASLRRAIALSKPAMVIPCDDRTVGHLVALLQESGGKDPGLADIIERSLGREGGFARALRRSEVISVARSAGVPAPEMVRLNGVEDLHSALHNFGFPAVLKVDGSWGGFGVAVVHTAADAEAAYRALVAPLTAIVVLKRLLVDREAFSVFQWLKQAKPVVNVQRFVPGRPATSAVACWNGRMLACSTVEVLQARSPFGASTVVKRIHAPAMVQAAAAVVKALQLSGLCGFDFLLDDTTGAVQLLECNPRATPLCHLNLGDGADPLMALLEEGFGLVCKPGRSPIGDQAIAFFPQCWLSDPGSAELHAAYHDVPWPDPDLVRELARLPWPERGLLARVMLFGRKKQRDQIWRSLAKDSLAEGKTFQTASNDDGSPF